MQVVDGTEVVRNGTRAARDGTQAARDGIHGTPEVTKHESHKRILSLEVPDREAVEGVHVAAVGVIIEATRSSRRRSLTEGSRRRRRSLTEGCRSRRRSLTEGVHRAEAGVITGLGSHDGREAVRPI